MLSNIPATLILTTEVCLIIQHQQSTCVQCVCVWLFGVTREGIIVDKKNITRLFLPPSWQGNQRSPAGSELPVSSASTSCLTWPECPPVFIQLRFISSGEKSPSHRPVVTAGIILIKTLPLPLSQPIISNYHSEVSRPPLAQLALAVMGTKCLIRR